MMRVRATGPAPLVPAWIGARNLPEPPSEEPMLHRRRDAWVFLRGRAGESAIGAGVTLLEAGRERVAGRDGGAGGGYAWAIFPETAHGVYTVEVRYPSGVTQTGTLLVDGVHHQVTLDEPAG